MSAVLLMLSCKAPVSSAPDTSAAQPDTSTADTSAPDTGADTAAPEFAVPEHPYLLSFHTCMTEETSCGSPQNHTVQLAGSDDGATLSSQPMDAMAQRAKTTSVLSRIAGLSITSSVSGWHH